MEKIQVMNKPEAWSYGELECLGNFLSATETPDSKAVLSKINSMLKVLEDQKDSKAIFLMPQNTFDIFSIFQGNNAVCAICLEDARYLLSLLNSGKTSFPESVAKHFSEKLKTLEDFLAAGNGVNPVVISASEFDWL